MKEDKLKFNTFITYILCAIEIENEDKKKEKVNEIITILTKDDMKNKINLFIKIKKHYRPFEKEEIVEILSQNNIEYKQDLKKDDLINLIFEQKPEPFSGI